jgi:magnesium-transporting ATPase (P-type)
MFFSVCAVSTAVPFIPILGAVCYMLILLPLVGFTMAWSDPDKDVMHRVPPKNDQTVTFGREEGWRLYKSTILKAAPPALFPQLLHLIAYGALVIEFEPELVQSECSSDLGENDWAFILRCAALKNYSGVARTSAGSLMLAEMILCTLVVSASFVHGTIPIQELPPWKGNRLWAYSVILGMLVVAAILVGNLESGTLSALPWYFYIIALVMLPSCLVWNEMCKRVDRKHDLRSEKLRRLQFETRLGMWSPK